MKKLKYFLALFSSFSHLLFSQQKIDNTLSGIRKNYEHMAIDDSNAMPYVRSYIALAKKEGHYAKLIQGYRDGRQFDIKHKIQYADSALSVSLKHGSPDDIGKDYLSKGIIYYFYHKKYRLALDQYLQAYRYSKGSKDRYLHFKVIYHMGVVKEHLGYYDEALAHFEHCAAFYGSAIPTKLHDNERYNYKKAYFNSLHQMTVIHRYLKEYSRSDSLSRLGYKTTYGDKDFELENSYFLKCIGISYFYQKNYDRAEKALQSALPVILKRNDLAWTSVIYYYLGKICETQKDRDKAIHYYSEIDTIFAKHEIILPEAYKSYHYLIEHYKGHDARKQLYYTNQLLKADSLISKDYPYLSSQLFKYYDRKALMDEREQIENAGKRKIRIAKILIVSGTIVLGFFVTRYLKDRKIKKHYDLLQEKIASGSYHVTEMKQRKTDDGYRKSSLTPEMTLEIREKLEKFESDKQFLKKGLTEKILAAKLSTNSHYLSLFINEHKGMNFNRYLADLRIKHITHELNSNKVYLHYTIEALAKECGIASRQNFSALFFEINGIRPGDFIKNRKKELGL